MSSTPEKSPRPKKESGSSDLGADKKKSKEAKARRREKKDKKEKKEEKRQPEFDVLQAPEVTTFTERLDLQLSCVAEKVTVFTSSAEVTRGVSFNAKVGKGDVVIFGLPALVDKESIRVSGVSGQLTILEVCYFYFALSTHFNLPSKQSNTESFNRLFFH